ncbi:MAG: V-type ATP synthase subunit E family protein [Candidatus Omnitrophota bacterium]
MNKEPVSPMDHENADAICAKIRQDAEAEVKQLSDRAQAQSQEILAQAKTTASAQKAALLHDLEKEIDKSRDRILSTLNLEKKRLILEGKQRFVDQVIAEVRQKAARSRGESAYGKFLSDGILEGMRVLDVPNAVVYYAAQDEHIFNNDFVKKLTDRCGAAMNKTCVLTFNKSDFKDIGVIINSMDGRMMYDNRFSARLERMYDDIYMELLKEAV